MKNGEPALRKSLLLESSFLICVNPYALWSCASFCLWACVCLSPLRWRTMSPWVCFQTVAVMRSVVVTDARKSGTVPLLSFRWLSQLQGSLCEAVGTKACKAGFVSC